MSESEAKSRPQALPEPGSRRWFWHMRLMHPTLWVLPLMPIGYLWNAGAYHGPLRAALYVSAPLVLCALALTAVSRALWRIEVNLAGNREHPFTDRDQRVVRVTTAVPFVVMLLMLAAVLLPVGDLTKHQKDIVVGTQNSVMLTMVCAGVVMASLERIYCRGKHAYEELEKGV